MTAMLFSGGIDSSALAWWKRPDLLITIDYGQKTASAELAASVALASYLEISQHIIKVDLRETGAGALIDGEPSVLSKHEEWWPFRNQLLLSVAATRAVKSGIQKILIGTVKSDSCFADGRPDFIRAMNQLLKVQEGEVEIEAPALEMSSIELVSESRMPIDLLPLCYSCSISLRPCGQCRSCLKYQEVLAYFKLI